MKYGGHAVLVVGWDDNLTYGVVDYGPVWILENSWVTSWRDKGFWRQLMITQSLSANISPIPIWQIEGACMCRILEVGFEWRIGKKKIPVFISDRK